MATQAQFQEGTLPPALDDFSAVKSKWVVMQHNNKKAMNNLHDLASVPDFDLLDPGWLDSAALETVGKPTKQGAQYEVLVAGIKAQQAEPLSAAKDGELETILNQDVDVAPAPPAPLFRDDEMESWLLATLDEPGEPHAHASGQENVAATAAEKKLPSGPGPALPPPGRSNKAHQAETRQAEEAARSASAKIPQMPQQLSAQRAQQRLKLQQQQTLAEQQGGAKERKEQQHAVAGRSPQAGVKQSSDTLHQHQQQLLRSQQQRLARQEQEQQQLAMLKQLQEEENEMTRLAQERKAAQEHVARVEGFDGSTAEAQAGHAHLLQRQHQQHQMDEQEKAQHEEQHEQHGMQAPSAPASGQQVQGGSAPLNFSHFSRPAHLYRRANLKTMGGGALRGSGAPVGGGSQQPAPGVRPAPGLAPKLPPSLAAKYASLSGASSVAESMKQQPSTSGVAVQKAAALTAPAKVQNEASKSPSATPAHDKGEDSRGAASEQHPALSSQHQSMSGPSALRRGPATFGRVEGQYADIGMDAGEGKDSQEQAHASTVTGTPPLGGRRPKIEKETTICSDPGAPGLPPERKLGSSMLSRGAATEMSARSGGSRFLKRTRDETEYTVSETMPEESEDTKRTGKKPGDTAGGTQDSAAKRARAAEVHNLSERRRRDRINERMRMLQELIPNSNKTDKASMLDEAIEYLKMLQLQLQVMSMRSGMSIPANLVPGASSFPSAGASSGLSQLPVGDDALSGVGAAVMAKMAPLGGLGESVTMSELGLAEMAAAGFNMADCSGGMAAPGLGVNGFDRELSSLAGGRTTRDVAGMSQRDMTSLPARQRLLMEMMQADLQEQQQHHLLQQHQQHQQQQQQQQQMLLSKAGAMASLQRTASGCPQGVDLPPGLASMGAVAKQEMFPRGAPLAPQLSAQPAAFGPFGTLRGGVNSASQAAMAAASGFGMAESLPVVNPMGAMAAAAVMLEGHRQLNPSAVDPLDVYLARQQRMQQQQLQLQEEQQQQQQQQAAVDFQMYQAILKRQNQTM